MFERQESLGGIFAVAPSYFMLALLLIFACLAPNDAFAWAPATHLYFAKEAMLFGHLLPVSIYELITKYALDFYYGCIAADITIGKAYVEYLYNCHNFDVGFGLLKRAKSDEEKAFVYGYLSHLAADTVSHNFFVPFQNVEHFELTTFRHAYWEVRLDTYFIDQVGQDMKAAIENPNNHLHDELLDGALKDTIFSFKTNRVLFSGMMAVQRFKKWQTFVRTVHEKSSLKFNSHYLAEYNRLAVSAIIHLFKEKEKSAVYLVDPTGAKIMEEAKAVRNSLRQMNRAGELTQKIHHEECERFRQYVRTHHFDKYAIEDKAFHPSLNLKVS